MKSKRILIVSYYWPPAGGPGVQRWLKFVKYLPQFGWQPTLFIPENPNYPLIDESLEGEVSQDLEVIKTKIWEPYRWAEKFSKNNKKFKAGQFDIGENESFLSKFSIFIRGNFFIPDARVFWVKPSIKYLKKYLKENDIDVLVTTGPPHSLHLIGLELKQEFPHLKWMADFRDPWTEISYYRYLKLTKWADRKHRELEQKVFENADVTLATSYTDADNFNKKGANAICITNGFDEEDCSNILVKTEKFTLSYIGVLEQLRNPKNLWQALNALIEENSDFARDFELKFVGRIDDKILENIMGLSLGKSVKNLGYLSHNKALEEMNKSDILLITNFNKETSKGIIPGKLFEYLATKRQIISFGLKEGDVSKILEETQAGVHFTYDEMEEVKIFIWEQYQNWRQGISIFRQEKIQQYSRKSLTNKLVQILEN